MSDNKNLYFTVTTVSYVSARNKSEALSAARSSRRVPGTTVLSSETTVDRIPAVQARTVSN